jgi:signal transduction histidine kinase/DNA-binding response OmpR family regulator
VTIANASGQAGSPTVVLDGLTGTVSTVPELFVDPAGLHTPADMVRDGNELFRPPVRGRRIDAEGAYVWLRFAVNNPRERSRQFLVEPPRVADTVWLYEWTDGQLLGPRRSTWATIRNDTGSVFPGTIPLTVGAGQGRTVLLRLALDEAWPEEVLGQVGLYARTPAVNRRYRVIAWNFTYLGLMLAAALTGLFVFQLFRQRSFLYFAFLTLSFALYFIAAGTLTDVIGFPHPRTAGLGTLQFSIAGIVLSISLFLLSYVRLADRFPRYVYAYYGVAGLTVLVQFVPYLLGFHTNTVLIASNVMLLVWTLASLVPVSVLFTRNDRAARRLSLATVPLAAPGIVYIIHLLISEEFVENIMVSIQLGTLGFTAILFLGLYNDMQNLRHSSRRLREQAELRSRFFANISHEFRTPLTLIKSPIDQLLHYHEEGSEPYRLLTIARENTDRQLKLVNRILQLAQLESGNGRLRPEPVDLVEMVRHLVRSFSSLAVDKGIALGARTAVDHLRLRADREKLEQILLNLLSNAFKFTSAGGRITVTVHRKRGMARVEVRDTGRGIEPDRLTHIFNRYVSSGRDPKTEAEGSGIGLALVRELVQLHGGTVSAKSRVGEGTTVSVHLPIAEDIPEITSPGTVTGGEAAAAEPGIEEVTASSRIAADESERPLVLIVEDNAELRTLLRYGLNRKYRIEEAENGKVGLAKARELQPELIITDLMMPEVNGRELIRLLKNELDTSHIPVIMLTARVTEADKLSSLEDGADVFLAKPFGQRELLTRVHNLISSRRRLRAYYGNVELPPSVEVAGSRVDREFLDRMQGVLDDHLNEETFRVGDFARALHMSPTSLNRKLRALLDRSSNQVIQLHRLRRADELLRREQGVTVAEVARRTGFSSSAYFVRVYREEFGRTPGSVKDEHG